MIYSFKIRLLSIVGVIALCLSVVLGRAFQIQVLKGKHFQQLALSQQQRTVNLEPKRGKIMDRNGRILAISVPVRSLFVRPVEISSKREVSKKLAPLLGIPLKKLDRQLKSESPFVWIKRRMNPLEVKGVKDLNLGGLGFVEEYRRYYPERQSGAALIGFTGIDSQGLEGIEFEYQPLLKGQAKGYIVEKEGSYRTVPLKGIPQPLVEQYSLQLTLDSRIQHLTEQNLAL